MDKTLSTLSNGRFFSSVNSDLSLKLGENNLSAVPMTEDGFAMMWAGVRANYGITKGQVAYEVKVSIP